MTYEQLAQRIANMTPEQRVCTVTLKDHDDEFFEARLLINDSSDKESPASDVLDNYHPYLEMKTLT